ncbi:photosystem II reaction center PSB28 protein, chloroplastic-like [Zingiber officinale]|uniref:photosystem II reaction center PSB28 protein, chloroplastic-like n=1 Tax=Zingiber officinale TaxID=94328 RepID=UPI001C4B921A|nr:photosystem II reaction center PSB28 protein, chloroplastic-like [Zingiber officinale]
MTKGFQVIEWIEGHDASNDDDNGDDEEAPRLTSLSCGPQKWAWFSASAAILVSDDPRWPTHHSSRANTEDKKGKGSEVVGSPSSTTPSSSLPYPAIRSHHSQTTARSSSLLDAAMSALVSSSTIAKCPNNPVLASPPAVPGTNLRPAFAGRPLCLPPPPAASRARGPWNRSNNRHRHFPRTRPVLVLMMGKPAIQFIQGTDEQTIPDVRLTKSRDGTNGVAIFSFDQPSVFDSSGELGDITGFYMIDEEGVLQSVDVSAKFVNGKPSRIEAKYVMRSPREWDRFMRFMERYSQANGLQFVKN